MDDIKNKKLLYHLTPLSNLHGILEKGLMPRSMLSSFEDIADSQILAKRKLLNLDNYVPFHWFSRNPFDGAVQNNHPNREFVIISVLRTHAVNLNWKVIPQHPVASESIELMDYSIGFQKIKWADMNRREYNDPVSKSVCMAECLSPDVVSPTVFFKLFVKNREAEYKANELIKSFHMKLSVGKNSAMFV